MFFFLSYFLFPAVASSLGEDPHVTASLGSDPQQRCEGLGSRYRGDAANLLESCPHV
jgi:hypothetical protein